MLVCIPFAWFWLLPSDMKSFSQSLIAVPIFTSNILFWRESGYFDVAVELKPLLHTWSLAVEEQYYVLYPLLLILFWKLGRRWILVTLGLMFVASFSLATWMSYVNPTAAFYLLPTRGWELLVGAFAGFYLSRATYRDFDRVVGEVCAWLGVTLIFYAVFTYSKTTLFPGFYALIPTLGTALIILFGTQKTTVGKIIGNRIFVGLGLISYSAYLWHQPVFAFARQRSLTEPSDTLFLGLTVLTVVLAYFSYRLVETPFRSPGVVSRRQFFFWGCILIVFFVSFGYLGYKNNGFQK
jgi:peptidoglycan/LPS O-acetylase OafA/YrhL